MSDPMKLMAELRAQLQDARVAILKLADELRMEGKPS